MKLKWIFLMLILVQIGTGCGSVPVENGRLSNDYAVRLESLSGIYKGTLRLATIDGNINEPVLDHAALKISVTQDGSVSMEAAPDWLGETCGMKFGKLLKFRSFDKKDPLRFDASFEVDPGKCKDKIESTSALLVSRRDERGNILLQTFLTKEHTKLHSWHGGSRPLNYFGQFSKAQ